ncbi:undecaprenyl-diphosphatase [Parelusimicrobium proximum]|uniref:undecaprenyl-diphosphate phosphatase n=1 Tax=Parelusimicrobium proximum TaxID=3228953 RepID=UPI003D17C4BE
MTILQAVILGTVQALGEFLPISSSAHLVIMPLFMKMPYQGLTYDVLLHLGTLTAVLFYFRKEWFDIIRSGLTKPKTDEGKTLWLLALGTIPAGVAGLLFESKIEEVFHSPVIIGINLVVFGIILFFTDKKATLKGNVINLKNILIIGCAQAIALMPGVSRSGITITAALLLGFSRAESAKVSFLLATPVIGGAAVLHLRHLSLADINAAFICGFLTSVVLGFLVIKFLMKYIQSRNFNIFVIYRVLLGLTIIGLSAKGLI